MKKYIISLLTTIFLLNSCDFLDVVPDDTAKIPDAFKNESLADGYMYSCYSNLPQYSVANVNYSWWVGDEVVGTPQWGLDFFQFMKIQQGLYSSSSPLLNYWSASYEGIRKSFTMLNNIDVVQNKNMSESEFEDRKKDWRGQVYFLIGFYHYILMENYGPIILIDKEMPHTGGGDDFFRKRRPVAECADFISYYMDEAIKNLPDSRASQEYGKPTKLIAQTIKARAYMLSASPLFNGNTDPFFIALKNKDGEQLIDNVYDKEKWKKAMDEFKQAIVMAEGLGYKLYLYPDNTLNSFDKAVASARYTILDSWNSEIIWAYTNINNSIAEYYTPRGVINSTSIPSSGVSASLKTVEMFYSKNGIPCESDPGFDWKVETGESTCNLNLNREPRFYAWIGYDRGDYEINGTKITLKLKYGETNGVKTAPDKEGCIYSGYAIKKMVHPNNQLQGDSWSQVNQFYPLIRLTELYLSYCEASAEYNGSLDSDAKRYFNLVRTKAGIPSFESAFGNPTGSNLVNIVRKERMIDFVFEGFWSLDLKRWMLAESFYADAKQGMWGLNVMGTDNESFYQKTRLSRFVNFDKKNYLYPITNDYIVNGNKNLVQNPGW